MILYNCKSNIFYKCSCVGLENPQNWSFRLKMWRKQHCCRKRGSCTSMNTHLLLFIHLTMASTCDRVLDQSDTNVVWLWMIWWARMISSICFDTRRSPFRRWARARYFIANNTSGWLFPSICWSCFRASMRAEVRLSDFVSFSLRRLTTDSRLRPERVSVSTVLSSLVDKPWMPFFPLIKIGGIDRRRDFICNEDPFMLLMVSFMGDLRKEKRWCLNDVWKKWEQRWSCSSAWEIMLLFVFFLRAERPFWFNAGRSHPLYR